MPNYQLDIDRIKEEIDPVDSLTFQHIESRYRSVQIILSVIAYLILGALALFLLMTGQPIWCIVAEAVISIALIINIFILRKAWLFKGYALRENDITYRGGIVFPTYTTIPFNRVQQVSVKQNPVSKIFRLFSIEVVNGAQGMASMTIPGLTEDKANQIKSIIIAKLKNDTD